MGSKPTIKDVAKKAGVSTATVSYVLNNNPDEVISEKAKKRVWDAAKQLNYHPAAAAVGLARQRSKNLGVILYQDDSAVTNQFYSFVIQGVIREAMDRDYNLLFSYVESTYKTNRDLPKIIREANVAGVIFVSRVLPRMLRDIQEAGIPVVAIDNYPQMKGISSIQIDNRGGGNLAAEHLIGLGHKHVAFLGNVIDRPSIVQRCEGFVHALERHQMPFARERNVVDCEGLTFQEGYARSLDLLKKNKRLTAIFCANDETAAGALRAAHLLGRTVPRDLSVVGFDNITMTNYTDPPLTTIGVIKEQMGRRATTRLLELVDGLNREVKEERVPVELVVRESTAPPGADAEEHPR